MLRRGLVLVALTLRGEREVRLLQRELAIDRRGLANVIEPGATGGRAQTVIVMLDRASQIAQSQGRIAQGKVDLGAQRRVGSRTGF